MQSDGPHELHQHGRDQTEHAQVPEHESVVAAGDVEQVPGEGRAQEAGDEAVRRHHQAEDGRERRQAEALAGQRGRDGEHAAEPEADDGGQEGGQCQRADVGHGQVGEPRGYERQRHDQVAAHVVRERAGDQIGWHRWSG